MYKTLIFAALSIVILKVTHEQGVKKGRNIRSHIDYHDGYYDGSMGYASRKV